VADVRKLTQAEIAMLIAREYQERMKIWDDATRDALPSEEPDQLLEERRERYEKTCRHSLYQIGLDHGVVPNQIDQAIEFLKTQS